jgi:GNAT superfamily N-acetyltransferase
MPLLFSYGTLQQADVQRSTFGRLLDGTVDELVGFEQGLFEVKDPEFVATSGKSHHATVRYNGRDESRVRGMVFVVTDAELASADQYEPAGYQRVAARLASGQRAWVYAETLATSDAAVRPAEADEVAQIAQVWYDAWRDAHAHLVPAELARVRTLESFDERIRTALTSVRVVGVPGAPTGFCMIKGDELYQLFVAAYVRGSGTAAALLADGEARLAANGVERAWLACAIGNTRAARFYEKHGWQRARNDVLQLEIPGRIFPLEVWRYEKALAR